MFTLSTPDNQSPTVSPANVSTTAPKPIPPTATVAHTEPVRLVLFGSLGAVKTTIKQNP